jgi:hypothetical protein
MTSFQLTVISIPTVERDQPFRAQGHQLGVLTIHERREIRACEGVKIVRRNLGNSVSSEECVIEKQAALYGMETLGSSKVL